MKLTLQGEFTTLNEYIDIERGNKFAAASLKRSETERVQFELSYVRYVTFNYPLDLTVFWYCKNRKKDPDNIAFAIKFILDGLQAANIIDGDGWKQINSICHVFKVDKENPRVELFIEDLGDSK